MLGGRADAVPVAGAVPVHARETSGLAKRWDRETPADYKHLPDHAKKRAHREALRRKLKR
jgi:hypothetical protein